MYRKRPKNLNFSTVFYLLVFSFLLVSTLTPHQAKNNQTGNEEELFYPALDISTGAVKARPSDMYHNVWEELGYTGRGINIAMLDTGVDDGHETFQGRWVAGVEITNPADPRDGSTNPDDRNGHGTRVASCLVGNGGPNGQYRGLAPDAGLIEVKVANDLLAGFSTNEYLMDGVQWCIDHMNDDWGDSDPSNDGIDVLSISYANQDDDDGSSPLAQKVDEAVDAGLIVIVAIGNDGPDNDGFGPPSSSDKAITIGGIDDKNTVDRSDDEIWEGSTRGPRADDGDDNPYDELKPEIVAPAVGITAAQFSLTDQNGEGWDTQDGTSYATPHASGTAALMLEANPELTQFEIDRIMRETAEPRGTPDHPELSDSYNREYGYGILDSYQCVLAAMGGELNSEDIHCEVDVPVSGEKLSGMVNISGRAWADRGDIEKVELSIDGGAGMPVNGTSNWSYDLNTQQLTEGEHNITVWASVEDTWSEPATLKFKVQNTPGNGEEPEEEDDDDSFLDAPPLPFYLLAVLAALMLRRRE